MTACITVEPSGVATLMADCVVSRADPAPALSIEQYFPEDFRAVAAQFRGAHRKIYQIGNSTAVACSGDVKQIRAFLLDAFGYADYIDHLAPTFDEGRTDKPLYVITTLANSYRDLQIIALTSSVGPGDTFSVNQQWADGQRHYSEIYGPICFSGSGGFTARDIVKATDRAEINWGNIDMSDPVQAILSLHDSLNYQAVSTAIITSARSLPLPDWGGLFELIIKPGPVQPWQWRDDHIQLFAQVSENGHGEYEWNQIPIFVGYQPLAKEREILLGARNSGRVYLEEVKLETIVDTQDPISAALCDFTPSNALIHIFSPEGVPDYSIMITYPNVQKLIQDTGFGVSQDIPFSVDQKTMQPAIDFYNMGVR